MPTGHPGAPGRFGGCAGPARSCLPGMEVTLQLSHVPPTVAAPGFCITRQSGHPGKDRSPAVGKHAKHPG